MTQETQKTKVYNNHPPTLRMTFLDPVSWGFFVSLCFMLSMIGLALTVERSPLTAGHIFCMVGPLWLTTAIIVRYFNRRDFKALEDEWSGPFIPEGKSKASSPISAIEGNSMKLGNVDIPGPILRAWCRGTLDGVSPKYENWVGKGKPFDGPLYTEFLRTLDLWGYAYDKGGSAGWTVTEKGLQWALEQLGL